MTQKQGATSRLLPTGFGEEVGGENEALGALEEAGLAELLPTQLH